MSITRVVCIAFCLGSSALAIAQDSVGSNMADHPMNMQMGHEHHATMVPVTYEELTKTAAQLEAAKTSTAKYQDVRVAQADGYQPIGPDVPGMGIHYVGSHSNGFDVEHPDILLYEKSVSAPGGYALVGVSYLFMADTDTDGQPKNPPFPKSLASWHRHSDLCVFPDRSVRSNLTGDQCNAQGGTFTALTQWMIHAWIWKESPAGVFSPTNPSVQ